MWEMLQKHKWAIWKALSSKYNGKNASWMGGLRGSISKGKNMPW
jgi:hypothetical protein